MKMKFSGVMLGSDNAKRLGEFYTKVLGKPGWQQDDWYGFWEGSGVMIGPHSEVKGSSKEPPRVMMMFEVEDVKGEFARIEKLGAKAIAKPYQPSMAKGDEGWLATLADPDGNYFQLATPWKD